jgi:hypothetical protein
MPATTKAVVLSCRAGGSGLLRSVKCGPALRLAARSRSEDMVALRRALIDVQCVWLLRLARGRAGSNFVREAEPYRISDAL